MSGLNDGVVRVHTTQEIDGVAAEEAFLCRMHMHGTESWQEYALFFFL